MECIGHTLAVRKDESLGGRVPPLVVDIQRCSFGRCRGGIGSKCAREAVTALALWTGYVYVNQPVMSAQEERRGETHLGPCGCYKTRGNGGMSLRCAGKVEPKLVAAAFNHKLQHQKRQKSDMILTGANPKTCPGSVDSR